MSKLGYLASRAPSAMFSKSRKTAMVASEVLVVIGVEFTLNPQTAAALEPMVVEADADPFGVDAIRYHFMPQPAFEEHQLAWRRRKCPPGPAFALGGRFARRCCHEAIQTRILELDSGGPCGDVYVV